MADAGGQMNKAEDSSYYYWLHSILDSHPEEIVMVINNQHCLLYFILRTFQIASVLDKVQANLQV